MSTPLYLLVLPVCKKCASASEMYTVITLLWVKFAQYRIYPFMLSVALFPVKEMTINQTPRENKMAGRFLAIYVFTEILYFA